MKPELSGTGEQLLKAQLGHLIAKVLLRGNMTTDDVARMTGVPAGVVSRIIAGLDRSASVFRLIELLGGLGFYVKLELRGRPPLPGAMMLATAIEVETGDLCWRVAVENASEQRP